jgi:hypothetical protein
VADDAVGQRNAGFSSEGANVLIAEEGRGIVHEVVKSAHTGEGGVEGGLVAGEQGFGAARWLLLEVAAQGLDLGERSGRRF